MRREVATSACIGALLWSPLIAADGPKPTAVRFEELGHDSPAIGICAASTRDLSETPPDTLLELTRRGGRIASDDTPWSRCLEVPAGELALGLWAARCWLAPGSTETPTLPVRIRDHLAGLAAGPGPESTSVPLVVVGSGPTITMDATGSAQPRPNPTRTQRSERMTVMESEDLAAPALWIGYPMVGVTAREEAALGMAAWMLAAPRLGRLPRLVVRGRHRATDAMANVECVRGVPFVVLRVGIAAHSTVDRVERYVASTLKQMRIVGPSVEELDRARRAETRRLWQGSQRPVDRARRRADRIACGLPAATPAELVQATAEVTATDVKAVAANYLRSDRRSVVEVYPPDWPQDDAALDDFRLHTVKAGETWADLAALYGVAARDIAAANDSHPRFPLVEGEAIWVPPPPAR